MKRTWFTQHSVRLLAIAPLAWWIGVTWVVPMIIRGTHAGRLPLLGRLMSGRSTKPVAGYLDAWEPIARGSMVLVLTTALILIAVLLLLRHGRRRQDTPPAAEVPPASAPNLLLIAAWCGLATGFAEAYYYLLRLFYLGRETPKAFGLSQHAAWMSPVGDLVAFLLLGVVVLLVRRLAGNRRSPRTVVAGLVWLGLFSVTMATDRLHWAAAAVLTLGIAYQVARLVSPGAGEVAAMVRRSLAWMILAVAVLGLAVPSLEVLRERRQLAEAGAPGAGAPNVLFIVMDTERAISTSLHGASRPTTPFLEALAREGVQFEWAISQAGWTLPSHAAMFTGHPTRDLGVNWTTPLGQAYPTLAEVMGRRGYATAGFVANDKFLADVFGLGRGFGRWEDQEVRSGTVVVHSWLARSIISPIRHWLGQNQSLRRKTADHLNAEFLGWLDHREARPFFAFLNYFDPHMPYLPPKPWNLKFSPTPALYWVDGKRPDSTYTPAERAELETAYESSIAYLDNRMEALFAELRTRNLLQNTLVIITSDHGEEFGEHGPMEHGFDLTMPLIHVPLVLVYPGKLPAGSRVTSPVELRRLAATVAELTGAADSTLGGESLVPYWTLGAEPVGADTAFSVDGAVASLVTPMYHYLRDNKGRERLFDIRLDPRELHDLSGDSTRAGVRDSLLAALKERMGTRP